MKYVSVITPTLNSSRFVEDTMRTVAMQRENGIGVQHLIIDGGSTDTTSSIVATYAHPDTTFIVEKDNGPTEAINRGLSMANGEFLCWLNSDDAYAPNALSRAVAKLERHPNASFCFGHCPIIDETNREIRKTITLVKELCFPISCRFSIRTLNYISQPAMVFRKSAFLNAGPLRTDMYAAWDYEFILRLWKYGRGVHLGNPNMAFFRWTPSSISGRGFKKQFEEELNCVINDAGKFALSTSLHRAVCRFIVFCYNRMTKPDKTSNERAAGREML